MTTRILGGLLLLTIPAIGLCQVQNVDLYQYNNATISPAFAGIDGMKITALGNTMLKKRTTIYSAFAGFETSIGKVGTGITANATNDGTEFWSINLPVNYQWRLGETRKLVFGARVSVQHTAFNYSWVDSGGQNIQSPTYYPTGRVSQTGWTSALGMMYKGGKFFAGFSIDNVAHSKIEYNYLPTEPVYHIIVGKDFGTTHKVEYSYSVYTMWFGNSIRMDLNNSILIAGRGIVGFSMEFSDDAFPKVNAGYRFGNVAQVIVSLYSAKNEDTRKKFSGQMFLQFNLNRRPTLSS